MNTWKTTLRGRIYDLYCSPTPEGECCVSASLSFYSSAHNVRLFKAVRASSLTGTCTGAGHTTSSNNRLRLQHTHTRDCDIILCIDALSGCEGVCSCLRKQLWWCPQCCLRLDVRVQNFSRGKFASTKVPTIAAFAGQVTVWFRCESCIMELVGNGISHTLQDWIITLDEVVFSPPFDCKVVTDVTQKTFVTDVDHIWQTALLPYDILVI